VAIAEAAVPRLEPPATLPARVEKVTRETHDTFTLQVAGDGVELPAFEPGQFSMLYGFGVGDLPISISSDPAESKRHCYTIRAVGRGTESLVSREPGEVIGVRGPFGRGWPLELARERDLIVVAGGIGLAPLRPVIHSVLRQRHGFGRLAILYGARSPRDLLYRKELARWARQPETQVLTTVDCAGLDWHGSVGVVTSLFRRLEIEPARTVAMSCGPEIMMRHVAAELLRRGLSQDDIFLSMERSMKCGTGHCGHCQLGPAFACKDGPVFPYRWLGSWINVREI
jgi:NAD(P)H-flavin reductase